MTRQPIRTSHRRRRFLLIASCCTAIVVVVLYCSSPHLLARIGRWLDVSTPPETVDFVYVLGGGSETRPFVAAAMVNAKLAREVVVPRFIAIPDATDQMQPQGEHLIKKILVSRGVPEERIVFLEHVCTSTHDEAQALATFLTCHPDNTVAVVTSNYHTRRARQTFQKVLGERAGQVSFVAVPTDGFDATDWWKHEMGFVAYSNEIVKLVFYKICY